MQKSRSSLILFSSSTTAARILLPRLRAQVLPARSRVVLVTHVGFASVTHAHVREFLEIFQPSRIANHNKMRNSEDITFYAKGAANGNKKCRILNSLLVRGKKIPLAKRRA